MNVTIPDEIKPDENTTIVVNLPEDATGNITITIDGNKTIVVPVTNGTTNITIPPLGPGEHNITVDYSGDDKYADKTTNNTVDVDSNGVKLTTDDVVMIYKDGSRLYATLLDYKGNPIANTTLSFTINGITYNKTTNASGVASLAINLNMEHTQQLFPMMKIQLLMQTVEVKSSIIGNDLVKMWMNGTQFYATFLGQVLNL